MFSRVNETGGRFTCISWLVHIHGGLHWVTVPKLQLKDVQSKVLKTTAICWLEWEDVMARGHSVGDTDNWELEQPNSAKVQHDTVTAQTQPNDALTRERVWRARHIFLLVLLSPSQLIQIVLFRSWYNIKQVFIHREVQYTLKVLQQLYCFLSRPPWSLVARPSENSKSVSHCCVFSVYSNTYPNP